MRALPLLWSRKQAKANRSAGMCGVRVKLCTCESVVERGGYFEFLYFIQHCLLCRPSDSNVSEDAGIKPLQACCDSALAQSEALTTRLDLI